MTIFSTFLWPLDLNMLLFLLLLLCKHPFCENEKQCFAVCLQVLHSDSITDAFIHKMKANLISHMAPSVVVSVHVCMSVSSLCDWVWHSKDRSALMSCFPFLLMVWDVPLHSTRHSFTECLSLWGFRYVSWGDYANVLHLLCNYVD